MQVITFSQGLAPSELNPFRRTAERFGIAPTILSPDLKLPGVVTVPRVNMDTSFTALRWHRYVDYLLTQPQGTYLICDCRDLIFNGPLHALPRRGLNASEENRPIGQCYCNSNWIDECYHSRICDSIKPCQIICAGVMWGERDWLIAWGRFVIQHYAVFRCIDQGCLNYAAYTGAFPVRHHPNGLYVLTCEQVPDERLRLINGIWHMHHVCPTPIIHQWNRTPGLRYHVMETYTMFE